MKQTASAFWTVGEASGELRSEMLPVPGAGEVLVRALFSAVSRGTELLVFHGKVSPSQFASMRAPFQAGEFPFPVKYGYSSVGRVEEGPSEWRGRYVFCLYPHQTAYIVPLNSVVPLPPDLSPERAVLAANMETALNGLWDARLLAGDRVAVVGAGTVGCLFAYLAARIPGTEVTLVDIDARKASIAARLGVAFALPPDGPRDADCVVEASGAPEAMRTAIELAGKEATILQLSWFGNRPTPLRLGDDFFSKRLVLRASQVGTVSPNKRGWTHQMRLRLATNLLCDDDLDALITGESRFEEMPDLMKRVSSPEFFALCHRIRYD